MQLGKFEPSVCPHLDFATEDGVLRIGPLKRRPVGELIAMMKAAGISTGADEDIKLVPHQFDTVYLIVCGEAVTGYPLEAYGVGASQEDIGAFLLKAAPANMPIRLNGHFHPDDETRIASDVTAVHDGKSVSWSYMRTRIRDGEQLRLESSKIGFTGMSANSNSRADPIPFPDRHLKAQNK
jgi:hypothetical protein